MIKLNVNRKGKSPSIHLPLSWRTQDLIWINSLFRTCMRIMLYHSRLQKFKHRFLTSIIVPYCFWGTCLLFPRQSWWFWTSKVQILISCTGVSLMLLLKPAPSELIYIRCPAPEFTSYFKELNFWSPESPCKFVGGGGITDKYRGFFEWRAFSRVDFERGTFLL